MIDNVFKLRSWISETMPSDAKPMSDLQQEFEELERAVRETIGLLEEVDGQKYWLIMFRRALLSIEAKELAGATSVLSCFGGEDTFSDLRLEQSFKEDESLHTRNLNLRLDRLRGKMFESAKRIASRSLW